MPLVISGVQYSGLWTRGQQMQAVAANTWTGVQKLFAWGRQQFGQSGLGNTTTYSSPVQVGSNVWLDVAAGYQSSYAVRSDNTLWSWGVGSNGGLGLNNTTNYSSPKQVGILTNWAKPVGGGYYLGGAIKTDGTLWMWGWNPYGQVGNNTTNNTSSPVQVGVATNWSVVSCGYNSTYGVRTDGTLWSWGYNAFGKLGLNDSGAYTNRSSPVQVGALTNWQSVSGGQEGGACLAIKTDGTIWGWGYNFYGNLGLGNTTTYSSPKQIGALTNWADISAGYYYGVAIKTNGTIWAWGLNSNGQLGLGDLVDRSSPVQIGALSNWSKIFGGGYVTAAISTSGNLWMWGYNAYGSLGLGNITYYSSPKQVGSQTSWKKICPSASYNTLAINAP